MIDFPSLKRVMKLSDSVNAVDMSVSPNGLWAAVHYHLSRPLTGHSVLRLKPEGNDSSRSPQLPQATRFAPTLLEDWAPDSKAIVGDWRTPDPRNDGNWLKDHVVLFTWPKGKVRMLGEGSEPRFSADGQALIWLKSGRRRDQFLVGLDLKTGSHLPILARGIAAFAVRRLGSSAHGLTATAYGPGLSL
jgi:hypothetical protein